MQELTVLYKHMLEEMQLCRQKRADDLQRLQWQFDIAENHKFLLCEQMRNYKFMDEDEELVYYRRIKPLFFSESYFYSYCYHTELFLGDCNTQPERIHFLKRQVKRLDRFRRENPDFYACITGSEGTSQREWFTSLTGIESGCKNPPASKGELLMATWIALNRFTIYVKKKIKSETARGKQ